jgi:uncharacterized membrane protein
MQEAAAILMGVSLAACAGLRAFLPLLAVGLAARMGWFPVQDWLKWVATNEALITFGIATVLEVAADKVPVVDHALDAFHTVARPVAGAMVAMGSFYQVSPTYAVALGIIVGAPIAGSFHLTKASTRLASTGTTAGFANPFLSFVEDVVAFFGVILSLVAPVLAALSLVGIAFVIHRWVQGYRARKLENRSKVSERTPIM